MVRDGARWSRWAAVAVALAGCGDDAGGRGATDGAGTTTQGTTGETSSTSSSTSDNGESSSGEPQPGDSSSGGASSTGMTAEPACEGEQPTPARGLVFDGQDDHVTMGAAPELGLGTFTLEAWIKRDVGGRKAGTGAGGLLLEPVVAKGRGENDDTIYNCNYAFGLFGNVLGADFEDAIDGGNHPVVGQTPVSFSQWHHVAATYDGELWRLYLDGVLDGQVEANVAPEAMSIQHFSIGTMMNSEGVPAGAFSGSIDEVRVWDHARSAEQITQTMHVSLDNGEGLLSRWGLGEQDGGLIDSAGEVNGTALGAAHGEGVVLDEGLAPVVAVVGPSSDAPIEGTSAMLEVSIADDQASFVSEFYLREVSEQDDFTIVVLPDTQYYSDIDSPNAGDPQYFHDQTQWVRDNRDAYNIRGVIHNGDVVNNGDQNDEWTIADAAMSRLEEPEPGFPSGVPYGISVGNHDQDDTGLVNATTTFNTWFGIDRFAGREYYGGHFGGDNDENWVTFWAGGLQFVIVNLQYDPEPDPAVHAWARSVFEAHPRAFGVLNSHYIVTTAGGFGAQGAAIYDDLKDVENLHLMTSGHVTAEQYRTDEFGGHVIHSMVADYQFDGDGGSGFMRIWEFSPAAGELTVRSYSPSLDEWLVDDDSEFTIALDLPGAGEDYALVQTVDPASHEVAVQVDGLTPGRIYEWYATVSNCTHSVTTPVQRFRTGV